MKINLNRYSKLLPALVGVLVQVVALGFVPAHYLPLATAVISLATAAGVYVAPANAPAPPPKQV